MVRRISSARSVLGHYMIRIVVLDRSAGFYGFRNIHFLEKNVLVYEGDQLVFPELFLNGFPIQFVLQFQGLDHTTSWVFTGQLVGHGEIIIHGVELSSG